MDVLVNEANPRCARWLVDSQGKSRFPVQIDVFGGVGLRFAHCVHQHCAQHVRAHAEHIGRLADAVLCCRYACVFLRVCVCVCVCVVFWSIFFCLSMRVSHKYLCCSGCPFDYGRLERRGAVVGLLHSA